MSLLQTYYDRICNLIVVPQIAVTAGPSAILTSIPTPIPIQFSSKQADGSTGYRIKFHVQLVTGPVPVPNPAVIHIYNLGPISRALVSNLNNKIILQAGYGSFPQTIFSGNVQYAVTRKEQADYITEIHASDGLFAFQNSLVNQSFGMPTPTSTVITFLISQLQGAGISPGNIAALATVTSLYNKGIVLSGKVTDELQKICDKNNLAWTIENGVVNITRIGQPLIIPPLLISPQTGLVGIPEQRAVDITGSNSLISFRILMTPSLGTYQPVIITSKFIPGGTFSTTKVTHSGDTFQNDWYTDCEATTAGGP